MNSRLFRTAWNEEGNRLGALRREVFVLEQKVPEELEWDEHDAGAIHFACEDLESGEIIATARLVVDSQRGIIGRLCVAKPFRQRKIATHMMQKILVCCTELQLREIELHAQLYLQEFYERCGFTAQGETYIEAGIPHVTMLRSQTKDML